MSKYHPEFGMTMEYTKDGTHEQIELWPQDDNAIILGGENTDYRGLVTELHQDIVDTLSGKCNDSYYLGFTTEELINFRDFLKHLMDEWDKEEC